ncbi:MAG: serine/threonine protein phosphatase 1 [Natronomonas sp.]
MKRRSIETSIWCYLHGEWTVGLIATDYWYPAIVRDRNRRMESRQDTMVRKATRDFSVRWKRIDPTNWNRIVVVGDVHGCRDALERLLDRLAVDDEDLLVFVGDLIRKGPDDQGVVDIVRGHDNMLSVRGNNEQKVIDGDVETGLDSTAVAYLASLPVAIGWGGDLVVHGGVDPDKSLAGHDMTDLQTMRSMTDDGYDGPFWFHSYRRKPRIFFGHTVLSRPLQTEWAVGLDTGCVYGGELTAYIVGQDRFLSVEPKETYRERNHDSIVIPKRRTVRE